MYSFTIEEFNSLRNNHSYRITNGAWNRSKINHPSNIGYLMKHIGNLQPQTYAEWEAYFYENIADKNKILEYAKIFQSFVIEDKDLMREYNYHQLHIDSFCKMVECRLIYETWLGYKAEEETCRLVVDALQKDGCAVIADHLSPEEDNQYAVDFLLYNNGKLICGLQVKSQNYLKSKQQIVQSTIDSNHRKNELFSSTFGVPVLYAYYKRVSAEKCVLVSNDIISDIKSLIHK